MAAEPRDSRVADLSVGHIRDEAGRVTSALHVRFGALWLHLHLDTDDRMRLISALSAPDPRGPMSLRASMNPLSPPLDYLLRDGRIVIDEDTLNARKGIE